MCWMLLPASCLPASSGDEASAASSPGWRDRIDRFVGGIVSPGTLAEAHAHLSGMVACAECHSPMRGTPDGLCADCHEDVERRMQANVGVHGAFEGPCAACHTEHRGREGDLLGLDPGAFNHDRALFVLRGAHREAECESCHLREDPDTDREAFHALGIAFSRCADCHEDVHGGAFLAERDCEVCHDESSWMARKDDPAREERGFHHDTDTRFPLEGRHASVDCSACHTAERRDLEKSQALTPGHGAPSECRTCHEDIHQSALGDDCGRCHVATAWQGPDAVFDHTRHTDFALDPLHASLSCASCHVDERFQAEASDCAGCHTDATSLLAGRFDTWTGEPDPHEGRVACQRCHPAERPGTQLIDYGRACLDCHAAPYGALLLTRKRLRDELVVSSEAMLRRKELAVRRGETPPGDPTGPTRSRIERLSRSGAHNPSLAERILREEITRLETLHGGRGERLEP